LDPSWVKIYPYQSVVEPGGRPALQIRVQNYKPSPMKMEVSLVAPAEWSIEPDVLKFEVPPRSIATQTFHVSIPKSWTPHSQRFAIAADVVRNRKYLGQITEAVVEVARSAPNLEAWPQT
jgi:hypothetical protein